jgi:ketosteroid isomerase-like protein
MSTLKNLIFVILLAVALPVTACRSANAQSSEATEQAKIVETVKAIFAAATTDDLAKFNSVVSPGFYMFDGGARFEGDAIMRLIKADHAAGKIYEWNVTDPDVHIQGDTAWIAYKNKGSVTDANGTQQLEWLESAFLRKETGVWKIVFFHSTRALNSVTGN